MKFLKILFMAALALLKLTCVLCVEPIIVGYYPQWRMASMTNVDFTKYTHINMGFVNLTETGKLDFQGVDVLTTVIAGLQEKNIKVLFSVGGWSYSLSFSTFMKEESKRKMFISNIEGLVDQYRLDGIDIDWEYPGRLGLECNSIDEANDTPNYLKFVTELRSAFNTKYGVGKKLITMAVRAQPFDINGKPMTADSSVKLADFAKSVDFANIMAYDISAGPGTMTGPNAPLNFEKGKGVQLSVASAIDEWTQAGWPANQLTLGIGFYGRANTATVDMTQDPKNQYQARSAVIPKGDHEDNNEYSDGCNAAPVFSGVWRWANLRKEGVLTSPNTAASPWVRTFDSITQTPWLFNTNTKVYISYDDPDSIKAKVDYAKKKGLAGTMVWSVDQDYNGELVDVLHTWGTPVTVPKKDEFTSLADSSKTDVSDDKCDEDTSSYTATDVNTTDNEKCDEDETGITVYSSVPTTPASTNPTGYTQSGSSVDDGEDYCDDGEGQGGTSATSSSANTIPTTPGTSAAPSASATPGTGPGSVSAGSSCTTDGEYQCSSGASGTGTGYLVCDHGKWIAMACGTGTVCKKTGGVILCGWP